MRAIFNRESHALKVTFHSEFACRANIMIYDIAGKGVFSKKISVHEGSNDLLLNVNELKEGNIYLIRINSAKFMFSGKLRC
jgi:hypothetical protein